MQRTSARSIPSAPGDGELDGPACRRPFDLDDFVRPDRIGEGAISVHDLDGAASLLRSRRASIWQLEPGRFAMWHESLEATSLRLVRAWFSRSVRIECGPSTTDTLVVPDGLGSPLHVMGTEIPIDAVALCHAVPREGVARPWELVVPGSASVSVIEMRHAPLAERFGRPEDVFRPRRPLTVLHGRGGELREIVDASFRRSRIEQERAHVPLHTIELERLVLDVARPLVSRRESSGDAGLDPTRAIARIATLVSHYLATHEPMSVDEMCRVTGLSRRALTWAFRKRYGVPPRRFFRALALNEVRRELTRSHGTGRISDVAPFFGFWHMSRLAADYKNHFGELPSETLEKNRWARRGDGVERHAPRRGLVATA
jgi:AraC family transcriptional regulator, ethanolamine operon transcriptional activator